MTDEEREHLLRSVAKMTSDLSHLVRTIDSALRPVVELAVAQFVQLNAALTTAGLLDENGQPTTDTTTEA